jgi:protein TonB
MLANRSSTLPAITVTLALVESSSPEVQSKHIAVGPPMQQADETPKEPPKVKEKLVEEVVQPPSPPQQAEVTLPQVEQKVEQPTPEVMPPAPETRAPPKNDRIGQFSEAGSNGYDALVLGHFQRFKRYPRAAHGASSRSQGPGRALRRKVDAQTLAYTARTTLRSSRSRTPDRASR